MVYRLRAPQQVGARGQRGRCVPRRRILRSPSPLAIWPLLQCPGTGSAASAMPRNPSSTIHSLSRARQQSPMPAGNPSAPARCALPTVSMAEIPSTTSAPLLRAAIHPAEWRTESGANSSFGQSVRVVYCRQLAATARVSRFFRPRRRETLRCVRLLPARASARDQLALRAPSARPAPFHQNVLQLRREISIPPPGAPGPVGFPHKAAESRVTSGCLKCELALLRLRKLMNYRLKSS